MIRRALGWLALATLLAVALQAQEAAPPGYEVRLLGPQGLEGAALRQALLDDLERTPRRHALVAAERQEDIQRVDGDWILALIDVRWQESGSRPTLQLAQARERRTPGWLVHAVLRAGATVGVTPRVVDQRSSWLAQLVDRSTRRETRGIADEALELGAPALIVEVPRGSESDPRLLAAAVRRLDGLDGYPVFEDEFLVVGGRVLLRRDLYWLGLAAWLALFWRGRRTAGREFRWLLLGAWLMAPVHSALLLTLPALAATWLPKNRWVAGAALLPTASFLVLLVKALAGPWSLAVSALPAFIVTAALAAFVWQYLGAGGPLLRTDNDKQASSAARSRGEA